MPAKKSSKRKQPKMDGFEKKIKHSPGSKETVHGKHEQRLMFERLLTELSVAFVKIPAQEVDDKVEEVLQSIGDMLGFDRVNFVQYLRGTKQLKITHSWSATGGARYPSIIPDQ